MSYFRIYPSRTNTIFKRAAGAANEVAGLINTGQNTISELTDGNTQSTFLMSFDLTPILPLLAVNPYTTNLKLWDAGVIFEPSITLKTIDLVYFEEEFTEGDGWAFIGNKAVAQASNWIERVSGTPWSPAQPNTFTDGLFPAHQLNTANEDLLIPNLQSFIAQAITNSVNPNFGIRISENEVATETFTKFIYTRHTRTIYKPYLEFFINDGIIDGRSNTIATNATDLFLLSETKQNFVGTLTVDIKDSDGNILFSPSIVNVKPGVYKTTFTPLISQVNTIMFDVWSIDGTPVTKNTIEVKSPNQISTGKLSTDNLFFYPTTSYLHQSIRKNDVVLFNVTSEIRGKGSVVLPGYEYKVIAVNDFEMQPWTPVNLFANKLFFTIDTSYYFPNIEYEVFVRLKEGSIIKTSKMSYRFKLEEDGPSHLRDVNANPYNSR